MSPLNLFKLEKMRIDAYKAEGRAKKDYVDGMDVMFNPTSFQENHENSYQSSKRQAINSSGRPAAYSYTPPADVSFNFVLDGTGVAFIGAAQLLKAKSVKKEIATFKKLFVKMNGDIHEPNYLKVTWGDFVFSCRLVSLDITYKLFDKAGNPLRAELAVKFVKDEPAKTILLEAGKNSPDLTHVRTVESGDTLPLLCKEIYGSSEYYLRVARENDLDDFRNLTPGQKLIFSPLESGQVHD